MNPGKRIRELIDWRFPQFDEEMEKIATQLASVHDDVDLEKDVTVEAIDRELKFSFDRFVDSHEPENYAKAPYRNDDEELTESGRNYIRFYLNNLRDYEGLLTEMPDDEFDELYKAYEHKSRNEITSHTLFRERMAVYNSAESEADFARWIDAEVWSAEDAAALSLGKEPGVVNSRALEAFSASSPFVRKFNDRLDLLQRAIRAKRLPADMSPTQFVIWARNKKWEMPLQLSELSLTDVIAPDRSGEDHKESRKSAETRVDNTLLAILAALLAIKYDWDLSDVGRSGPAGLPKITENLMKDLRAEAGAHGIELVTNNALKGWLKRAIAESAASALKSAQPVAPERKTAAPTPGTKNNQ